MLTGGVLLASCAAVNLSGVEVLHFSSALVLLGLGWNFLFIGSTTLLTESYQPAEKAKVQGVNDLLVFATVAMTATSSGALHHALGWSAMNTVVLPFIMLSMIATLWLRADPMRQAALRAPR